MLCDVLGGSTLGCGAGVTAGRVGAGLDSSRAAACVEEDEQVNSANSFRKPFGRPGSGTSGRRGPVAERACSVRTGEPTAISVVCLGGTCEESTLGRASGGCEAPSVVCCCVPPVLCKDVGAADGTEGARVRFNSGSGTSTGECGTTVVVGEDENPAACTGFPSAIEDCAAP